MSWNVKHKVAVWAEQHCNPKSAADVLLVYVWSKKCGMKTTRWQRILARDPFYMLNSQPLHKATLGWINKHVNLLEQQQKHMPIIHQQEAELGLRQTHFVLYKPFWEGQELPKHTLMLHPVTCCASKSQVNFSQRKKEWRAEPIRKGGAPLLTVLTPLNSPIAVGARCWFIRTCVLWLDLLFYLKESESS